MCDVYVTPYLNEAQMTSGTLAYSFGSGKGRRIDALLARQGIARLTGVAFWFRSAMPRPSAREIPAC